MPRCLFWDLGMQQTQSVAETDSSLWSTPPRANHPLTSSFHPQKSPAPFCRLIHGKAQTGISVKDSHSAHAALSMHQNGL